MDQCASCKAPIFWAITEKGKRIPIDAEPVANGNIVMLTDEDGGGCRYLKKTDTVPEGVRRYVSHFATCDNPGRFRKK